MSVATENTAKPTKKADAEPLSVFLQEYGVALKEAVEKRFVPRFDPARDPLPDLRALEACRSRAQGKPFQFFPSQRERVGGIVVGLRARRSVFLVCDCGTGKTAKSLAAAWMLNHKAHILVMCPSHLPRKWAREAEWLLPNARTAIVKTVSDLNHAVAAACAHDGPFVVIVGKEAAKLGVRVDHPACAERLISILSEDERTGRTKRRMLRAAACPRCGVLLLDENTQPVEAQAYREGEEPTVCKQCGELLYTCQRGAYKHAHLDRYIQRRLRGFFDVFIADEVHELAGKSTCQGNAFGTIASVCKYVMALTGTLIGGRARDLHATLWRMAPDAMLARGFRLRHYAGSRVGAIARNETTFSRRYGVMEYTVVRSEADDYSGHIYYGRAGRRKSYRTPEVEKPGISPRLFTDFLLARGVFLGLDELGAALPPLERGLTGTCLAGDHAQAYRQLDEDFKEAIKRKSHGKFAPSLAATRVIILDAYGDKPWGWSPIYAPIYENGVLVGRELVSTPQDLGAGFATNKDGALLRTVKAELKKGRKCAVYCQFTGTHDVRGKILEACQGAKLRAALLPDSVQPAKREAWLMSHESEIDVLILNPKRVMTGLDLIPYPTLIFYQVGLSTHVLRQASARARRPNQPAACKVLFLYHQDTIQGQALALMAEKEAASQALEGTFDSRALRVLMNGGEDDDVLSALAHSMDKPLDLGVIPKAFKSEIRPHQADVEPPEPRSPEGRAMQAELELPLFDLLLRGGTEDETPETH
jgi:hypothetical protein